MQEQISVHDRVIQDSHWKSLLESPVGIETGDPRGAVVGAFVKDDVGATAGVEERTTGDFVGPVVNVFVDPRERNAVSILA